jgi:hypothetical protein
MIAAIDRLRFGMRSRRERRHVDFAMLYGIDGPALWTCGTVCLITHPNSRSQDIGIASFPTDGQ